MPMARHLLFVCSRNQWRSPTAERLYARVDGLSVRSRGTSSSARRRLSTADVAWADLVLVMEDEHARRVRREFRDALGDRPVHVLDVPDDYAFMDPELCDLLRSAVDAVLDDDAPPDLD